MWTGRREKNQQIEDSELLDKDLPRIWASEFLAIATGDETLLEGDVRYFKNEEIANDRWIGLWWTIYEGRIKTKNIDSWQNGDVDPVTQAAQKTIAWVMDKAGASFEDVFSCRVVGQLGELASSKQKVDSLLE